MAKIKSCDYRGFSIRSVEISWTYSNGPLSRACRNIVDSNRYSRSDFYLWSFVSSCTLASLITARSNLIIYNIPRLESSTLSTSVMDNVDMDAAMAMAIMATSTSASMNDINNMRMNRSKNPKNTIRLMAEQEKQDPFSYAGHPQFKKSYGYGYGHDYDKRATPAMSNLPVAYGHKRKVSSSSQPHGHGISIGIFGRGSSFVSNGSASPLLNSSPPSLLPVEAEAAFSPGRAFACANAKKSSIASASATAITTSGGKKRHLGGDDMQMQLLQEEVGCLNDLGCSLFDEGHFQKSVVHFHHGLYRIKKLSLLKRQQESRRMPQQAKKKKASASHTNKNSQDFWLKACMLDGDKHTQQREDDDENCEEGQHGQDADSDDSDSGPAMKAHKRPGSLLLPVDTSCHVWSNHGHGIHWETITSIVIMHNASMVYFKAKSYSQAKILLDLARGLLKRSLTSSSDIQHTQALYENPLQSQSLNTLLVSNQYTVSVVVSLHIAFGRVILKLPSVAGEYKKSQCQAHAKREHRMASILLKRYNNKQLQEEDHCQKTRHSMGMGVEVGVNTGDRNTMDTKMSHSMEMNMNSKMNSMSMPISSMLDAFGMDMDMPIYNNPQHQKLSRRISGQHHDSELDIDTSSDNAGVSVYYDPMEALIPHNCGAAPVLRHPGSSSSITNRGIAKRRAISGMMKTADACVAASMSSKSVIHAAMDREEETKQHQLWQHHQRDLPPPPLELCSPNDSSHNRYQEALQTALQSIIGKMEQEQGTGQEQQGRTQGKGRV
jgi:hypothetical protein